MYQKNGQFHVFFCSKYQILWQTANSRHGMEICTAWNTAGPAHELIKQQTE